MGGMHTTPRISLPDESIPLRYLTEGVMQTLSVFDPDTDRIETGINTLDNPRLPLVYQQGWAQW